MRPGGGILPGGPPLIPGGIMPGGGIPGGIMPLPGGPMSGGRIPGGGPLMGIPGGPENQRVSHYQEWKKKLDLKYYLYFGGG